MYNKNKKQSRPSHEKTDTPRKLHKDIKQGQQCQFVLLLLQKFQHATSVAQLALAIPKFIAIIGSSASTSDLVKKDCTNPIRL